MSKGGLPDPLKVHSKMGMPDPLKIMAGSNDRQLAGLDDGPLNPNNLKTEPLPQRGANDPAIDKRATEQFATRDALMQRQASAAGATRSENEADLLGTVRPAKRSGSAARKRLLGE